FQPAETSLKTSLFTSLSTARRIGTSSATSLTTLIRFTTIDGLDNRSGGYKFLFQWSKEFPAARTRTKERPSLPLHADPVVSMWVRLPPERKSLSERPHSHRCPHEGERGPSGKQGRRDRTDRPGEGSRPRVFEPRGLDRQGVRREGRRRRRVRSLREPVERGDRPRPTERSDSDHERMGSGMARKHPGQRGQVR